MNTASIDDRYLMGSIDELVFDLIEQDYSLAEIINALEDYCEITLELNGI